MEWFRSSFCGTDHVTEQCIEVAVFDDGLGQLAMRNRPGGPWLDVTRKEFEAFVSGAKAGEFDHLT